MEARLSLVQLVGIWVLVGLMITGIGLAATYLMKPFRVSGLSERIRGVLWFGLLVTTVIAMGVQLFSGLTQGPARWVLIGLLAGSILVWVIFLTRHRTLGTPSFMRVLLGLVPILIGLILVGGWALGEPTNYDTGLYHLGAISYAQDHPVIPGLANLHERFGFNSAMWPLAAALANLSGVTDAFRLVNGLIVLFVLFDLVLRLMRTDGSRRWSPGTFVLLLGLTIVVGAMALYPGRLVATASQDTAALLLGLVAIAYLSDAIKGRGADASTVYVAIGASVLLGVMRPLGWVFFVALLMSLALLGRQSRSPVIFRSGAGWVFGLAAAAVAVVLARDVMLSGWLGFPLSLAPMPVDWLHPDPEHASRDILGWARTPFQPVDVTLASNSWITGWLLRLPTDWAVVALVGLLALAGLLVRIHRPLRPGTWSSIALTLVPVGTSMVVWLITAPDPRFAWGPILALGLVPVSFLASQSDVRWMLLISTAVVVSLFSLAAVREAFVGWSSVAIPAPPVDVREASLADGTVVTVPSVGDQCWASYPLCRPDYAPMDVELRGEAFPDGFRPSQPVSK